MGETAARFLPWPSGRDSKGDRLGIGPLWRLSFSDFFPRWKEIGPPEAKKRIASGKFTALTLAADVLP